ncbi:MAG: hypothetical protein LBP21_04660 [Synergistaceae bacterium]|nr:hypothetical protein [Synergistaceae bacterium]
MSRICRTDVFDDQSFSLTTHTKRKGMGIAECLILMVVVVVTFGAIFSVMAAATKSHGFSKQDKNSRELFFSWIQTFESLYPNVHSDPDDATEAAAKMLGGTWTGSDARIGGFILTAVNSGVSGGSLELHVTIRAGDSKKPLVDLKRTYNSYSNETVSDDAVS